MIEWHADDFAMNKASSEIILNCAHNGALNGVSIFANADKACIELLKGTELNCAVHLNLVEGKSLCSHAQIPLITGENGFFSCTFFKLLLKSFMPGAKKLSLQIEDELAQQIKIVRIQLGANVPLRIDSHQHTHMIPCVYRALKNIIAKEKLNVSYLRIPTEPITPYLKCPSVLVTVKIINLIKAFVLGTSYLLSKIMYGSINAPTAIFCGVILSGKMDEARLRKLLPHFGKIAEKKCTGLEILFHPGSLNSIDECMAPHQEGFVKFYLSPDRRTERQALLNLNDSCI